MNLGVLIVLVPAWLFADRLGTYRLHSDDFAYVAASRNLEKTLANLFVPHNTHIVPSWRLVTWAMVAMARRLVNLPDVLAMAAYGMLAANLILLGRFVTRETRRTALGLTAMVALGTTSVIESSATWYSSGQTLWASFGILSMLWYLQGWRRWGGSWRLVAAVLAAWVAGGFWTIGHAAGPVGAVYLWADGRRRCRIASAVPLSATTIAVVVALLLGGSRINAKISFHGRTSKEAVNFVTGAQHTLQAIPEDLVFQNLGVEAETSLLQGAVLTALIVFVWGWSLRPGFTPTPLEGAGGLLLVSSYFVEWSFRGYLPFSSLRGIVPWYDTIPLVGAILFAMGWWSRRLGSPPNQEVVPLSRAGAIALLLFQGAMVVANQPRVDALFIHGVPEMSDEEAEVYVIPELQLLRARYLAAEYARLQRIDLAKLDRAERVARRLGIGREAIRDTFGRVEILEIPKVYDANGMLDLPWKGTERDRAKIRSALGELLTPSEPPALPLPGRNLGSAPR